MDEQIKTRLLASKKAAAMEVNTILNCHRLTESFVREHIRKYVLCKFMLTEADCPTDNMDEITKISLSHAIKIDRKLIEEVDMAARCDGANSVIIKKVLLFMAIRREFDIEFSAGDTAKITSTEDLAMLICRCLLQKACI